MTTAPTYMSTWNTSWTSVSITKNTIAYHHLTPQTFMETFKMCRRWFLVLSLKASPANCSLTANNTGNSNKSKKKGEVLGWMANTTAYNPTFPIGHFKLQWHVTSPSNLGQKTTQKTNLPENSSWFGKWQKPHCRRGGEPHKWRLNCWSISLETISRRRNIKDISKIQFVLILWRLSLSPVHLIVDYSHCLFSSCYLYISDILVNLYAFNIIN